MHPFGRDPFAAGVDWQPCVSAPLINTHVLRVAPRKWCPNAVKVDGISRPRFYRYLQGRELRVPAIEVIVEVEDQCRQTTTTLEVVEGFDMVRVDAEETSRLVARQLFGWMRELTFTEDHKQV